MNSALSMGTKNVVRSNRMTFDDDVRADESSAAITWFATPSPTARVSWKYQSGTGVPVVEQIVRHPAGWPGSYIPVGYAVTVPPANTFGVSTLPTAPAISNARTPYRASIAW